MICRSFALLLLFATTPLFAQKGELPPPAELPETDYPDPLVMFDGTPVKTVQEWEQQRKPELRRLFQHYMYGYMPAAPDNVTFKVVRKKELFDGKALKKEVIIKFGPQKADPIMLLVVLPKNGKGPVPCFVGLNFCGNHSVLNDPSIAVPTSWMRSRCPGCEDHSADPDVRGGDLDTWSIEQTIDRGYGVATYYQGDIDPDKPDFTDGIHPHYFKPGQTEPAPTDWGTIAAWAWGLHRCVDYLVTDPAIAKGKIAVFGHSRNGKTALVAAAYDERIALAIPHQAGCGGTSPSRHPVGESVERINTSFPHWFSDTFTEFNKSVRKLPFDQHCLVALCAPRPVLFSNAVEDQWADPEGQFMMLQKAEPVYELYGVEGLSATEFPPVKHLVKSRLGYYIRPGKHSTTPGDWKIFCDFADEHLK
jgi:hypothetical protein